jgi:hypothetical protein
MESKALVKPFVSCCEVSRCTTLRCVQCCLPSVCSERLVMCDGVDDGSCLSMAVATGLE